MQCRLSLLSQAAYLVAVGSLALAVVALVLLEVAALVPTRPLEVVAVHLQRTVAPLAAAAVHSEVAADYLRVTKAPLAVVAAHLMVQLDF